MQLNKYNLGDVVMVQGEVKALTLKPDGTIIYTIAFPYDDKDIYCDRANVQEELITTVF